MITLLLALVFQIKVSIASQSFVFEDKSCILSAGNKDNSKITHNAGELMVYICESFIADIKCEAYEKENLSYNSTLVFQVEQNNENKMVIFSRKLGMQIFIEKNNQHYQYAEHYYTPIFPYLLSKHCLGSFYDKQDKVDFYKIKYSKNKK